MLFGLTQSEILAVLLIFTRVGALTVTAPLFSGRRVPLLLRAGLSLILALLFRPFVAVAEAGDIALPLLAMLLFKEALVGLTLGYVANMIFQVVQMAGEMQDVQAGFGLAGVVDPNFGQSSAVLGQLIMACTWLIFLLANGHHLLLHAMMESFAVVPLAGLEYQGALVPQMFHVVTALMGLALKMSAPVIAAVLLADVALGMLQRTAPQLNIIAIGFQVKIAVAVVVLFLALPLLLTLIRELVPYMGNLMHEVLMQFRPVS